MRGKEYPANSHQPKHRITPAYAGKSRHFIVNNKSDRDHPRVCGEKQNSFQFSHTILGSPPRMRGKAPPCVYARIGLRITPAYAGKSTWPRFRAGRSEDHPRVCGEKLTLWTILELTMGSPPRMRGKAPSLLTAPVNDRITPAYAGKRLKRSHSIGHFSCILCLFHSVLHRASVSGGSRAGPCAPPCLPAQNTVPV